MTNSHVTNSIAPSVDGTIKFESRCGSNDWRVKYKNDGAYLRKNKGLLISIR